MEQNTNITPEAPKAKMPITDAGEYIKKKYGKVLRIWAASILIIEALLFVAVLKGLSLQIMIFPIMVYFIVYAFIRQKAVDAFFEQFAINNGFTFQKVGMPGDIIGSLFNIGHSKTGRDLVSGKLQDTPFDLFNYSYTVGSGKNSHTYTYTVFRTHFTSSLPPVFLKSKKCYFGGFMFADISGEAKEELKLEGDFDHYFDLWVKHDFQIEVLQFFTPDVMARIQDNWKRFSLEFVDDQIYVYGHDMIMKDEELENMYQFIQFLITEIIPYAKKVKGDIEAMDEQYKN